MISLGTPPLKPEILISDHLGWHTQIPKSTKILAFPAKKNQPLSLKIRAAAEKTRNFKEKNKEMEVAHRRALAIKRVKEEAAACKDCSRDFSLFTTNVRGDSTTLFAQSWTPVSVKVRGVIVLLHGLNEHSGRYGDFAKQLNANGFKVIGIDWIGVANFSFEGPLVRTVTCEASNKTRWK